MIRHPDPSKAAAMPPVSTHLQPDLPDTPVVFLHGYLESPGLWATAQAQCAALGIPTAALPLPGHHPCPMSATALTRAIADDTIIDIMASRIATAFPDQPVRIVGHSAGALIALCLAASRANLITRLMLVGPLHRAEISGSRGALVGAIGLPAVGAAVSHLLLRSWVGHPAVFRAGFTAASSRLITADLDTLQSDMAQSDPACLRQMLFWITRQHLTDALLKQVQIPALIVLGTTDGVVPPQDQLDLLAALPEGRAVLLDTGHLPMLETPDVFARLLAGWLAQDMAPATAMAARTTMDAALMR